MSSPMSAPQILDREFLELRAKILELAASMDRLERAEGTFREDDRWQLLSRGLQVLSDAAGAQRAEQVQLVFSRQYDPQWRATFGLDTSSDSPVDVPVE